MSHDAYDDNCHNDSDDDDYNDDDTTENEYDDEKADQKHREMGEKVFNIWEVRAVSHC